MAIILGIDASSSCTGWSVYSATEDKFLDFGNITWAKPYTKNKIKISVPLSQKLLDIHTFIKNLLQKYQIDYVVLEDIFNGLNVSTLVLLAEIRGVIRMAALPAKLEIITTMEIKSCIGLFKDQISLSEIKTITEDPALCAKQKVNPKKPTKLSLTSAQKNLIHDIKKNAVMRLVNDKWGLNITCDDISDSMAICWSFNAKKIVN